VRHLGATQQSNPAAGLLGLVAILGAMGLLYWYSGRQA
jgi:LPXTG-motif cell wall-anchored protein